MAKKAAYVPDTPREIFEMIRRDLRSKVEAPDYIKAERPATWKRFEPPGTEYGEIAVIGEFTLFAVRTTPKVFATAPPGTLQVSWSILSKEEDDVIGGGGADSIPDAKEYAYLCYQAACGVIKGGDA